MDVQRSKGHSTIISSPHNWIGYNHTTGTSSQIQVKSKLCNSNETRHW
jgi:hypothetical protein